MTIAEQLARAKVDYDEVYEAGKKAGEKTEYDRFWDTYQDNGNRGIYEFAFAGKGWTNATFKPKYNLVLNGVYSGTSMFQSALITDLRGILEELGVTLDTKGCKNFAQFMQNSYIRRVPTLDFSNASGILSYAFANSDITSIQKLIVSELTVFHAQAFLGVSKLESVIFEGVIAKNNLDLHWSTKLNKESITSIINCLSTTTSGLTVTLSKTAVNKAFETSAGSNDGSTSTEWTTLIATKSNWTISLV